MTVFELHNDFHHTSVGIRVPVYPQPARVLSSQQVRRVSRVLCPSADCSCSGPLGIRWPVESTYNKELDFVWNHVGPDREISIRLEPRDF